MNKLCKTLSGKYNSAVIFNKHIEKECEDLLLNYLDVIISKDLLIRIMPDVHLGKETVIGFTSTINDYIVPGIIGVDIGCGVSAWNLGKQNIKYDKLDRFIGKNIPNGKAIQDKVYDNLESIYAVLETEISYHSFKKNIRRICDKIGLNIPRILKGIGSLGGGNHFIELDKDSHKNIWLLVHTGSRYFGYNIAGFHTQKAACNTHINESPIKYLQGTDKKCYLHDMGIAQIYAGLNRLVIGEIIVNKFLKKAISHFEKVESIHNYISQKDNILRKGAVSAHIDEKIIIPFSMSDGAVIGIGKGNKEWNYSAPHGSGRKMSRTKAKQSLSIEYFRKKMQGIWSSSVNEKTLDESPMAYKKTADIVNIIQPTIDIIDRLKPVYNFKES